MLTIAVREVGEKCGLINYNKTSVDFNIELIKLLIHQLNQHVKLNN